MDLRVMTWNVHALIGTRGRTAGDDVARDVARHIVEQKPHIVLVQELDRYTARSGRVDQLALLKQLTGATDAVFAQAMPRDGGQYGVAILAMNGARFAPGAKAVTHRLPRWLPRFVEPRVALEASIALPDGSQVTAISAHTAVLGPAQGVQLAALGRIASQIAARGETLVVGGDLNTAPFVVRHAFSKAGAPLRDAVLGAGLLDSSPRRITFPLLRRKIDHLHTTTGLRPVRAEVTRPARYTADGHIDPRPGEGASDHYPVVVDLQQAAPAT